MKKLQLIALAFLALGACKNGEKKSDAYGNFEAVENYCFFGKCPENC